MCVSQNFEKINLLLMPHFGCHQFPIGALTSSSGMALKGKYLIEDVCIDQSLINFLLEMSFLDLGQHFVLV